MLNDPVVTTKPILLVALGGNALIRKGQTGTIQEQFANLQTPISQIASLSRSYRIVVTHGNGPQVGNLLLQQECCDTLPRLPLEILVAQTQGQIGFMIECSLDNELTQLQLDQHQPFVTVLSYVLVDRSDPAFQTPSKPIGPTFSAEVAARLPYPTVMTPKGFRRVVASPQPLTIVEKREIKQLIDQGFIVIACGGGGIPVIRKRRGFHGIDAVIDKDLASCVLAREVGAHTLVIATDVPGVALHFGRSDERFLKRVTTREARGYLEAGQFPEGSMGPKITAAVRFLDGGGTRAVICALEDIEKSLRGESGTEILHE